jgi:capsular exopolysaccharide synthesis family protein
MGSSNPNNVPTSIAAVPTYAQLLTNPLVLDPVVAMHGGMTLKQLNAMITVKPQSNSQLIELDVQNGNPQLAMQLANEISQSFAQYANSQLPGNVQILPAQLPTDPIKPNPRQDAAIGALVGLGLAIALIVIFEWIDNRFISAEEVQEFLDMEVLTVIPYLQSDRDPQKIPEVVEKYRTLCANLNATQMIKPFKLLMITSALASEGKSKTSANIASFLAKTGKKVLLVDADLRHPALSQYFQLNNHHGLTTTFMSMGSRSEVQIYAQQTDIPTLRVLTSGVVPPNPAELLQTPQTKQLFNYFNEAPFDYVVFDTSPLLPVADAQIIASLVHAVILVVDVNKTPRRTLLEAKQVLIKTGAKILGVVINKSRLPASKYVSSYYNYVRPEVAPIMAMLPDNLAPDRDTVIIHKISSSISRNEGDEEHK